MLQQHEDSPEEGKRVVLAVCTWVRSGLTMLYV